MNVVWDFYCENIYYICKQSNKYETLMFFIHFQVLHEKNMTSSSH